VWRSVERPHEVHDRLRHAVAAASGADTSSRPTRHPAPTGSARPLPVIGLTGGIGSGKSTVAGILGELGCLVIDSDQRARAALDRPEVRSQLVSWWGEGILSTDGRIDRSKVAAIVFKEPADRARLEGLVHPIVRQDRAAMIAEASGQPFRAVVIDAPLLFEAGLDRECDAVVFVDAPRPIRLDRVRSTRGWEESELDRREQSQLSLDLKRSRSTHTVENSGDLAALQSATRELLDRILGGTQSAA
jgi:dephospho-CoA kinase